MGSPQMALVGAVLLRFAFAPPQDPMDWKAFDDPKAFLLTDVFATAIARLPGPEKSAALQRLHAALGSKEVEIQRRAALTLDNLGDKSGVPIMMEALFTATGHDRDNVVVALRILKDKRAIPVLRKALKDQSPYVRSIALEALGELKAVEAYDDIVALTRDKEWRSGNQKDQGLNCIPMYPAVSACYALGALGEKRAVPVLIGLLDDKDLEWPAIQSLEILTQQKLGRDPAKWKEWWTVQGR
jgi:HEAT repeat protein